MYFTPVGGKTNESYFWVSSGKISEALCPTSQNFILFIYFQYSSYSREHLKDFSFFFSIVPPLKNLISQTLAPSASINLISVPSIQQDCWALLGCFRTLVYNVPPAQNQAGFQALPWLVSSSETTDLYCLLSNFWRDCFMYFLQISSFIMWEV